MRKNVCGRTRQRLSRRESKRNVRRRRAKGILPLRGSLAPASKYFGESFDLPFPPCFPRSDAPQREEKRLFSNNFF